MSNLLTSVDPAILEAVTGGGTTTSTKTATATTSTSRLSSTDQLLQTLTSLSNTIKDIGNAANKSGFSTTDILLLGYLMSQRPAVNVIVRRPFW